MKAASVVAEILKREGVQFLIGYPVNQILEAAAEADIRTIIVRTANRPRAGWAEAARRMRERDDDRLLDSATLTRFDEREWRWR